MPVEACGRGQAIVGATSRKLGNLVPAARVQHILAWAREIQEAVSRMVGFKVPADRDETCVETPFTLLIR
jgi:hypothetical protein